jgi:hypothetical protein
VEYKIVQLDVTSKTFEILENLYYTDYREDLTKCTELNSTHRYYPEIVYTILYYLPVKEM